MASRRQGGERALPEKTGQQQPDEPSNITPAVPMEVIYKLLGATFLMIFAPLAVYFGSVNTLFAGNATWAGASAAITANIVLAGFIVMAIREDQGEQPKKVGKVE